MTDRNRLVRSGGGTGLAARDDDRPRGRELGDEEAPGAVDERPGRLLELAVADLALIERLRLAFEPGLNVLTGETGAGKSLVIDALGLALGARADLALVRHGAEAARVEALFDRLPEPLVAVRELTAAGRSIARLDDGTVTAARLAEVVGPLVEVHGQHDQSRLLDERWQRDVLDAFGGHEVERRAIAAAVGAWASNRSALAELAVDPRDVARRLELLEHEVEEIVGAKLRVGETTELRGRLEAARQAEAIARGAAAVRAALGLGAAGLAGEGSELADTSAVGARDGVAMALDQARGLARIDPRFGSLADRLAGLEAELEDAAGEARILAQVIEHDAAAVAAHEDPQTTN